MALIKRLDFLATLKKDQDLGAIRIYVFFGERYLCKQAADSLQEALLCKSSGAVTFINGDTEDPLQTLARLLSFSLLPGQQLYRVTDSRIFHSKTVTSELWDKAEEAQGKNKPGPARKNLLALVQVAELKIDSRNSLSELDQSQWKKLFGFDKPSSDISWADDILFQSRDRLPTAGSSVADQYIAAFDRGIPENNSLILTAETVDKRQRLYKYIKKNGTIVDCGVAAGAGKAAQTEQKNVLREMMLTTLAGFDKQIENRAAEVFFERVGFHPVAVVTETEKLAHYVGDRPMITVADLEAMVSRSREDALYELTDAFGKRQTAKSLTILNHLIDQGTHSLAILATLRNYLRKLLVFRSIQLAESPVWKRAMNAREFQSHYLPELQAREQWKEQLSGHPYALYMNFKKASDYSCSGLKRWLAMLLEAEFRLKGSPLPPKLVLEELLLSMLQGSPKQP
jgi:DNA polymerase-3 subunit delta